jgi:hypothetical protein
VRIAHPLALCSIACRSFGVADAYCALMIVYMNRIGLWERVTFHDCDTAPTSSSFAQSHQPSRHDMQRDREIEEDAAAVQAGAEVSMLLGGSSSGRGVPSTRTRASRREVEDPLPAFEFNPAVTVIFLVCTLHLAFSMLRTIYTRKNGGYRYGYLA